MPPHSARSQLALGTAPSTLASALCITLLAACGGGGGSSGNIAAGATMSQLAELGEKIFADESLSASGQMSCSTCHDPDHALASAVNEPVPHGGANLDVPGFRNAPSLRYVTKTPGFFFDDGAPAGGFERDGRANTLAEQARRPFLGAHEMANDSEVDVVDKLSQATYAADFKALFGETIFDQPLVAFERALVAIAQYEREDVDEFAPFTSKYDFFLSGKVALTQAEMRGLALFNDPQKGNCAACHPSGRGSNGEAPLFTDFSYDNLGVPRNATIPANADDPYFDLGLCGPFRIDLATQTDLCGAFTVPTLRNIAQTAPYFHNGQFATLTEALGFYVRRDTNPTEWFPLDATGQVHKFDDLPAAYTTNVNITEVPYNRHLGDAPALSPAEIDDVIAFLNTLTDGFQL
jgi:cytochrome c peroxidase